MQHFRRILMLQEALTKQNVEKTFPPAAQKPCHQPLSDRTFTPGQYLNCSYTQPNQIFRSYFDKRPLWYSELTQPCVLWPSERESTCSASNNGSSQERASHVEWRKNNSLQRQFKSHRSFAHTFLHKYQIGKHCHHQKNPTSQEKLQ